MDIKIKRPALVRALSLAAGATDTKSTDKLLSCVLLVANIDGLTVSATDLNVAVTARVPCDGKHPGSLAIEARRFLEVVKGIDGDEVAFSVPQQGWVEIRAGRSKFKLPTLASKDFPAIIRSTGEVHQVDAAVVYDLLSTAKTAAGTDETRTHLCGVHLEIDGHHARATATDGHRLVRIRREMAGGPKLAQGVLVPTKGVSAIEGFAEEMSGRRVGLAIDDRVIAISGDGVDVAVKLSGGQFPPADQVIPRDNPNRATMPRAELAHSIRRVSMMADRGTAGIRLKLDGAGRGAGTLTVEVENPNEGSAVEEIEVEHRGGPVLIGANARYFADALGCLESSPEVVLEFAGELDPIVVRPTDGTDFVGVIMPMRI
jgi:DNA polymerase-3 subunit beta